MIKGWLVTIIANNIQLNYLFNILTTTFMDSRHGDVVPSYSAKYSSKAYDTADNVVTNDNTSSVTSMPALETLQQNDDSSSSVFSMPGLETPPSGLNSVLNAMNYITTA